MLKIAQRFFTALVAAGFLAVFVCGALTGCKPQEALAAKVAVQYSVGKFIEKDSVVSRAEKVRQILATVKTVSDLAEADAVTIDSLRAYVAQRLGDKLSPADKLLAGAIIDAAAIELKARVGDGVLKPDQLVKVREVLSWVAEAAAAYAPPDA